MGEPNKKGVFFGEGTNYLLLCFEGEPEGKPVKSNIEAFGLLETRPT